MYQVTDESASFPLLLEIFNLCEKFARESNMSIESLYARRAYGINRNIPYNGLPDLSVKLQIETHV